MNPPILKISPPQSDQGKQQKHPERGRGPRERRFGNSELECEWGCRRQVFGKSSRHNLVGAGFQSLHRELGIVRQFLSDDFTRTVRQSECILKLLGEGAATNRRDIQQQTVLRVFQFQAGTQFRLFVDALANDPRRQHGRRHLSRFVPHQTSIRTGDYTLAAIGIPFRQHRKDALRRQTLFDVQTRDNRCELIVERHLHQAVPQRATPNLPTRIVSNHDHRASVDAGNDRLHLIRLGQVESLIGRQPGSVAVGND